MASPEPRRTFCAVICHAVAYFSFVLDQVERTIKPACKGYACVDTGVQRNPIHRLLHRLDTIAGIKVNPPNKPAIRGKMIRNVWNSAFFSYRVSKLDSELFSYVVWGLGRSVRSMPKKKQKPRHTKSKTFKSTFLVRDQSFLAEIQLFFSLNLTGL